MLYLFLEEEILATGPVWPFHGHCVRFHRPCVAFPRGPCSVSRVIVWHFHGPCVVFPQALCGVSTGPMWHFHGSCVVFPRAPCGVSTAMCGVSSVVWVSCGLVFFLFSMHQ